MNSEISSSTNARAIQPKHLLFAVFFLLTIVVWMTRDRLLLDPNSPLRQRYSAVPVLMLLHGIPGAIALLLGVFQFSSRLRQLHLPIHRLMGRIYVGCVLISAPVAVLVSLKLPMPTLTMASIIQGSGWILTTLTALYCVRTGRIQQHREWMIRSYPFAMVFVVVRAILAIPAVAQAGVMAVAEVVWSVIALACCLPSFLIAWQHLATSRQVPKVEMKAAQSA